MQNQLSIRFSRCLGRILNLEYFQLFNFNFFNPNLNTNLILIHPVLIVIEFLPSPENQSYPLLDALVTAVNQHAAGKKNTQSSNFGAKIIGETLSAKFGCAVIKAGNSILKIMVAV